MRWVRRRSVFWASCLASPARRPTTGSGRKPKGWVNPKRLVKFTKWRLTRYGILSVQKNKRWIIQALDRGTRRRVAWVVGDRDADVFRQLYAKVQHLTTCRFFTDVWEAFASVLPTERHQVGKTHTVAIEQDHSNTHHHLGRFTHRTKVVSKQDRMIDLSLRLWLALTHPTTFAHYQTIAMSIYK